MCCKNVACVIPVGSIAKRRPWSNGLAIICKFLMKINFCYVACRKCVFFKMRAPKLKTFINDFLALIFPNECLCCDTPLVHQERIICSRCNVGLPRTHFHLVKDNPIEQVFWGRVKIERATSFFMFKKGSKYQKLMHQLKYKNRYDIGVFLGKKFATELIQNSYFDDVDAIVPVPLHRKKEKKRGYNQSMAIAEGLSAILEKPVVSDVLIRKIYSETQTRKGRFERWENMNNIFDLKNEEAIKGRHLLLVDDILTTGSTIEACALTLQSAENVKISVATLAFASN